MYVEDFDLVPTKMVVNSLLRVKHHENSTRRTSQETKCRSTQDVSYRWTEMPCKIVQYIFGTKTRINANQWSILSCVE